MRRSEPPTVGLWGNSDPMREAGGPSTNEFRDGPIRSVVPAPPGVVMVSPPTTQRNASGAQCAKAALAGIEWESAAKGIIGAGAPMSPGPMIPTPTSLRQRPCSTRRLTTPTDGDTQWCNYCYQVGAFRH